MEKSTETKNNKNWKLAMVLAVCAAPIVFSYLTYYVIQPEGRTNYGALLDAKAYPMPRMQVQTRDNQASTGLAQYRGKWLMLTASGAACTDACANNLYAMRQVRLAQGKEMSRIVRIWLVTDQAPVTENVLREHDGLQVLKVDEAQVQTWLPSETGTRLAEHIFVIDPLGNLMMRFPKDADPSKIKKDISKLLRASAIG